MITPTFATACRRCAAISPEYAAPRELAKWRLSHDCEPPAVAAGYVPRHMVPPHRVPVAVQMLGRRHAYRTRRADPMAGVHVGDVVFTRSALHPEDTRCPECRRSQRLEDAS